MGGGGEDDDPGAGGDDRANLMEAIRQAGELAQRGTYCHGCWLFYMSVCMVIPWYTSTVFCLVLYILVDCVVFSVCLSLSGYLLCVFCACQVEHPRQG